MARLSLRVDFAPSARLGPGKVRLLELIAAHGSIAAAGRAMRMSYRRAWMLVEELNRCFKEPLVATQMGGSRGGGTTLTPLGEDIVRRYRAIEAEADSAVAAHLRALDLALSDATRALADDRGNVEASQGHPPSA
ncbi:MAG: winged helix-turn-helix domain-containing protein [Rhodospirillales bacterium]|nr:winged helix-turn-helix domain-containing protein [Rhodospirillales bacterium]